MVGAYCLSMLGSTLLFSFVQDRQQKFLFASMSVIFIPFIIRVPGGRRHLLDHHQHLDDRQQGIVKKTMGHHFPVVRRRRRRKHAPAAAQLAQPAEVR